MVNDTPKFHRFHHLLHFWVFEFALKTHLIFYQRALRPRDNFGKIREYELCSIHRDMYVWCIEEC
ncbi:hypothetical protein V6Z12_A11G262600 [Gossypium hirsutum]